MSDVVYEFHTIHGTMPVAGLLIVSDIDGYTVSLAHTTRINKIVRVAMNRKAFIRIERRIEEKWKYSVCLVHVVVVPLSGWFYL